MKFLLSIGVVMGFFSGVLITFAATGVSDAVEIAIPRAPPSEPGQYHPVLMSGIFFVSWVLSTFMIVRGTRSVSKVFSRGFLLGAIEWLATFFLFLFLAYMSGIRPQHYALAGGGILSAGLVFRVMSGVSIAMACACLIGFAISNRIGRKMKPEPEDLSHHSG
jgi:hypothetical protein